MLDGNRGLGYGVCPRCAKLHVRTLSYGLADSGKSWLGVSSFHNPMTRETFDRGLWITIGGEDNPAFCVPDEMRQLGGVNCRLTSPLLDSEKFLGDLNKVAVKLHYEANKGNYLGGVVFDGMSEFDLLYEARYERDPAHRKPSGVVDTFDKFDSLMNNVYAILQWLNPLDLHCDVFITAHVMERRLERESRRQGGAVIPGDPEYMSEFQYYPSMRGTMRLKLPHYANLVLYHAKETRRSPATGRWGPVRLVRMLQGGEQQKPLYMVKNQWEHGWLAEGLPYTIRNPQWPKVKDYLLKAVCAQLTTVEEDDYIEEGTNGEGILSV